MWEFSAQTRDSLVEVVVGTIPVAASRIDVPLAMASPNLPPSLPDGQDGGGWLLDMQDTLLILLGSLGTAMLSALMATITKMIKRQQNAQKAMICTRIWEANADFAIGELKIESKEQLVGDVGAFTLPELRQMARGEAALRAGIRNGRAIPRSSLFTLVQRLFGTALVMTSDGDEGTMMTGMAQDDDEAVSVDSDGKGTARNFSGEDLYDVILRLERALALLDCLLPRQWMLLQEYYTLAQRSTANTSTLAAAPLRIHLDVPPSQPDVSSAIHASHTARLWRRAWPTTSPTITSSPPPLPSAGSSAAHALKEISSASTSAPSLATSSPSACLTSQTSIRSHRSRPAALRRAARWAGGIAHRLHHRLLLGTVSLRLACNGGQVTGREARRAASERLSQLYDRLFEPLAQLTISFDEFESLVSAASSYDELIRRVRHPHGHHPLDGPLFEPTTATRRVEESARKRLVVARLITRHWSCSLPPPLKAARREGLLWGDIIAALTIEPTAPPPATAAAPAAHAATASGAAASSAAASSWRRRRGSSEERVSAHVQAIASDPAALAEMALIAMGSRRRAERARLRCQSGYVRETYNIRQRANFARAKAQLEAALRIQRLCTHWLRRVRERHALQLSEQAANATPPATLPASRSPLLASPPRSVCERIPLRNMGNH